MDSRHKGSHTFGVRTFLVPGNHSIFGEALRLLTGKFWSHSLSDDTPNTQKLNALLSHAPRPIDYSSCPSVAYGGVHIYTQSPHARGLKIIMFLPRRIIIILSPPSSRLFPLSGPSGDEQALRMPATGGEGASRQTVVVTPDCPFKADGRSE